MNRKKIIFIVLWGVLSILCFNPYWAFLGTLSYKYLPDSKAVPDTVFQYKLPSAGPMTVIDSDEERQLAKGTRLEIIGTCQYSGATYSPAAQVEGRQYLVQLADGTRGHMELPKMEIPAFLQGRDQMLVYLLPGGRRSATNAVNQTQAWLDAHKDTKMGVFTWIRFGLKKINLVALRLFKATSSKFSEGGHYFLFPRFQAWDVYDLPKFFRRPFFRTVWDIIISILFFMSAHLLARSVTRNEREASAWYYPLAVLITLLGVTNPVAWFFLFWGIFVRRSLFDYQDQVRCPKCHQTTLETYRRESIQTNSKLIETTVKREEGKGRYNVTKGYSYTQHLDFYDYDRCTHCGYVVPRHKSTEHETIERLIGMNKDEAIDFFNRTNGALKVYWDDNDKNFKEDPDLLDEE